MVAFVVLDIETTGLSPYRHAITEIAAVKIENNEVVDEFHTMVNPGQPIPSFIRKLTGITDEMVQNAPPIEQVLEQVHNFLGDAVFVGHNVGFDHKFIDHYSRLHLNKPVTNELLCTCKLARRLLPELPSKRLQSICDYYAITNSQAHRAMSDVLATKEILFRMFEEQQPKLSDPEQFLSLQRLSAKQVQAMFAKTQ